MRHYYTSKKKGVDVTCNICGKTIFLKRLKDRVVSGKAVQDEVYEAPEQPWTETPSGDLCPECSKIMDNLVEFGN